MVETGENHTTGTLSPTIEKVTSLNVFSESNSNLLNPKVLPKLSRFVNVVEEDPSNKYPCMIVSNRLCKEPVLRHRESSPGIDRKNLRQLSPARSREPARKLTFKLNNEPMISYKDSN